METINSDHFDTKTEVRRLLLICQLSIALSNWFKSFAGNTTGWLETGFNVNWNDLYEVITVFLERMFHPKKPSTVLTLQVDVHDVKSDRRLSI